MTDGFGLDSYLILFRAACFCMAKRFIDRNFCRGFSFLPRFGFNMVILCSFKLLSLHLIDQFDGLVKFLLLTFADEII